MTERTFREKLAIAALQGLSNKSSERHDQGLMVSLGDAARGELLAQIGVKETEKGRKPAPGKPMATYDNLGKAGDSGDIGTDQSLDESKQQLDF